MVGSELVVSHLTFYGQNQQAAPIQKRFRLGLQLVQLMKWHWRQISQATREGRLC